MLPSISSFLCCLRADFVTPLLPGKNTGWRYGMLSVHRKFRVRSNVRPPRVGLTCRSVNSTVIPAHSAQLAAKSLSAINSENTQKYWSTWFFVYPKNPFVSNSDCTKSTGVGWLGCTRHCLVISKTFWKEEEHSNFWNVTPKWVVTWMRMIWLCISRLAHE